MLGAPTTTNMLHFNIKTSASGTSCPWQGLATMPLVSEPQYGPAFSTSWHRMHRTYPAENTHCSNSWAEYGAKQTSDYVASKSSTPTHHRPLVNLLTSSSSVCCCFPRPRCGRC